jgi:DNA-binding MltR family transcriptional regulator
MAFTDPQTITVNTVAQTLNLVNSEGSKSVYSTADESFKMTLSHQESKNRTRRMVRVDNRVVAADPLTSENEYKSLGIYLVIDEPEYGFTDVEIDHVVQALNVWMDTANITKVLSSQH